MPEKLSPSGYLRGIHLMFDTWTSTNLDLGEDEDETAAYDPADDAPWSITTRIELRPDGR